MTWMQKCRGVNEYRNTGIHYKKIKLWSMNALKKYFLETTI